MTLSCSPGSKSALTIIPTAMGVAAITLAQAASAQVAPPEVESPSWTVALASPLTSSHSGSLALGNVALGNTSRWAAVIGQIQPQESPTCCFSDLDVEKVEEIGHAIDETLTRHQVYIMLALTLWFGATAPWILQQFWLSQQRLAYRGDVNRPRPRRSATRSSVSRSSTIRAEARAVGRTQQYRAVPLHGTQMPQRFARPRVVPVARPQQDWGVDRRPSHRRVVDVAAEALVSTGQSGRSQPKLQPAAVC